jgi:hypothetical protein
MLLHALCIIIYDILDFGLINIMFIIIYIFYYI